jgi:hypothetical protein
MHRRVSFFRAVYLCLLGVFAPDRLHRLDVEWCGGGPGQPNRSIVVWRAFWLSLLLMCSAIAAGLVVGEAWIALRGCTSSRAPLWLGACGAGLLLWATLFLRGWDILSWKEVTLAEAVNRWLFRAMSVAGTVLGVLALRLEACGP